MPRYKAILEFDGGPFVGWQRQENGRSVQQALEEAIAGFAGSRARATAAGRTDAGVHALGLPVHFDLDKEHPCDTVRDAVNAHLRPEPVAILRAERVGDDFNARFSATRRRYLYRILNRRAPPTVERGFVWQVAVPLDADAMHAAARALVGKHDFTTFRASECQARSPVKTLDSITVARVGDEISVRVAAPSFLHHQVRSIVGTLERAGAGKWRVEKVAEALAARDRSACGPVAPACGLYFESAEYAE